MITLSILIASLASRSQQLELLTDELKRQGVGHDDVEVLVCVDNKQQSTGAKRQFLLEQAQGKYIVFIDDDDWIEPYYIEELLKAAESDADCFAINGWITTNGRHKMQWFLSKDHPNITRNNTYLRTTNHITAVKRELALQAGFPNISNKEDAAYSERLRPFLKTEYKITKPLYHYKYISTNKEYE